MHGVVQFAHVTGPGMAAQQALGGGVQPGNGASLAGGMGRQQALGQRQDVVRAFAARRTGRRKYRQ
ncbi:hypothetical protein NS376_22755, partial [Pseudomonas oryzihabitans]